MKVYTHIRIDIRTGETLEEQSFDYQGPLALCDGGGGGGGGGGSGGDAFGGEGDTPGQGGTGGSGGNVGSGGSGGGSFEGWAPDPVSSGDPASGGFGGIGQGVGDGGSPVAGLAAAEAASRAASKAARGESLTDADLSAMITSLQDSKISRAMSAVSLARAYQAAKTAEDVDTDTIVNSYLDAVLARGELPESVLSNSALGAKMASFIADQALTGMVMPMAANIASKLGLDPIVGSLVSRFSSREALVSLSRSQIADSFAAKALGQADPFGGMSASNRGDAAPSEQSTATEASKSEKAGLQVGGGAGPQAAPGQMLASKDPSPPATLANRPVIGQIGTGRPGTVLTGPQGLEDAPQLTRKKTLLGG